MTHIYIANPKGGCGKTTIAVQLATYYARQGLSVGLVDHDEQKSCSDWAALRPKSCPPILTASSAQAEKLKEQNVVVHDFPAAHFITAEVGQFEKNGRVVIPILPSPSDIRACLRFSMALSRSPLGEAGLHFALVANRLRSNTHYAKVLTEFTERMAWPCVTTFRDTQNYVRTLAHGISIFDLPPHKVKQDLAQWQPLINWLNVKELLPQVSVSVQSVGA